MYRDISDAEEKILTVPTQSLLTAGRVGPPRLVNVPFSFVVGPPEQWLRTYGYRRAMQSQVSRHPLRIFCHRFVQSQSSETPPLDTGQCHVAACYLGSFAISHQQNHPQNRIMSTPGGYTIADENYGRLYRGKLPASVPTIPSPRSTVSRPSSRRTAVPTSCPDVITSGWRSLRLLIRQRTRCT